MTLFFRVRFYLEFPLAFFCSRFFRVMHFVVRFRGGRNGTNDRYYYHFPH